VSVADLRVRRFEKAVTNMRRVSYIWEQAGCPQSGPVYDELTQVRIEFQLADRACHGPQPE
jgi:hypothetical protein